MQTNAENAKSMQYKSMEYNVAVIGWFGEIFASAMLLCSALTLHWRVDAVHFIMEVTTYGSGRMEQMRSLVMHVMVVFSATCYALSLIYILVCTMLLIGVTNRQYKYLLPWLVYHGFLFGVGVHFSLYLIITGLFSNCMIFALALMLFSLALVIFCKIFHEVFLLYKALDQMSRNQRKAMVYLENENQLTFEQKNSTRPTLIVTPMA